MFALLKTIRIFAPLLKREAYGRLAQLVQSICLTSRGSAVRIRQRPPMKSNRLMFGFFCFYYLFYTNFLRPFTLLIKKKS